MKWSPESEPSLSTSQNFQPCSNTIFSSYTQRDIARWVLASTTKCLLQTYMQVNTYPTIVSRVWSCFQNIESWAIGLVETLKFGPRWHWKDLYFASSHCTVTFKTVISKTGHMPQCTSNTWILHLNFPLEPKTFLSLVVSCVASSIPSIAVFVGEAFHFGKNLFLFEAFPA